MLFRIEMFHSIVFTGTMVPANEGDTGLIPGLGRSPGVGNVNPLQYSYWEIHGQESLAGKGSWHHKESDITQHTHTYIVFNTILGMKDGVLILMQ